MNTDLHGLHSNRGNQDEKAETFSIPPFVISFSLISAMKSNTTKRRYKAQKRSACAMCKPYKRGWEDKKTPRDLRAAMRHEQELIELRSA